MLRLQLLLTILTPNSPWKQKLKPRYFWPVPEDFMSLIIPGQPHDFQNFSDPELIRDVCKIKTTVFVYLISNPS